MHFHANFLFFGLLLFVSFSFCTSIFYIFFVAQRIIFLCDRHQQLILQGKVFIVFHHYWIANLNLSLFFSFLWAAVIFFPSVPQFFFSFLFFLSRLWIYLLIPIVIQSQHNLFRLFSQLHCSAGNKKVLENNGIMKIFTRLFFLYYKMNH